MRENVLLMIVGMSVLSFAIRYLPIELLRSRRLAPTLEKLLCSLPIGILAALIAQAVFLRSGTMTSGLSDYYLPGFMVCLLVAAFTRNITALMFFGMATVGLLHAFGP